MLSNFLADLTAVAPPVGHLTYAFTDRNGKRTGFVQIIPEYQNQVLIHRLWTLEPRRGNGSAILNDLCEMADRHRIVLKLKALPLGAKPYPFSRDQLVDWYQRHGFEGRRRRMVRMPRVSSLTSISAFKVLQVTP